jgi:DNA-directed RNA polymerase subunit beta'
MAGMDGEVFFEDDTLYVRREDTEFWSKPISPSTRLRVDKGDRVKAGQQLTEGSKNPKEVLRIEGRDACQLYLLNEVQKVYRSQGVGIHDKHIEIVVRQMLRRVNVLESGDTDVLPGELIERQVMLAINDRIIAEGGEPARFENILMGVTKASLNTDSFLAAASFQETTRVLTDAAVRGASDDLRGLKENVIIGKLIPVGTGFSARMKAAAERVEIQEVTAREAEEVVESLDSVLDASFSSEKIAEMGMPFGMDMTDADLDTLLGGDLDLSIDSGGDGSDEPGLDEFHADEP